MLLTISIVSYNTQELTLACLHSVLASITQSPNLSGKTEIIVVDNNSSDGSVAAIKKLFATAPDSVKTHLIKNSDNSGFAKANNQAITESNGELVLLLNSDTLVTTSAIPDLVAHFQAAPIDHLGILAAQLCNADGSHQPQGGDSPSLFSLCNQLFFLDDIPVIGPWLPSTQRRHDLLEKTGGLVQRGWVGGTAMLMSKTVIAEIGLLDEHIFMYGEDVEFCVRASHHGWDICLDTGVTITHRQAASSSSSNALIGEMVGWQYLWSKHYPIWQSSLVKALLLIACLLRSVVFGTMGNTDKAMAYKRALQVLQQGKETW